jgi:uncharacterized protein YjgD (DUF1641 family)
MFTAEEVKTMTTEELILARLDKMEEQLGTLSKSRRSMEELKDDLTPLVGGAFHILMRELGEVEFGFQLEDLFALLKQGLRSIRSLTYALEQLENIIDFWQTMEPLLKSSVPNLIDYFDRLEQRGVFRTYAAMLEVRAKVATHYGPEEIAAMGDGFVALLSLLQVLSHPEIIRIIKRLRDISLELNIEEVKPVGPLGMVAGLASQDGKQGMGVMLELIRGLGKAKIS